MNDIEIAIRSRNESKRFTENDMKYLYNLGINIVDLPPFAGSKEDQAIDATKRLMSGFE